MNNYIITTDTTTDLPEDYIKKHDLGIMSLTYTLEGTTYSKDNPLDVRLFYEKNAERLYADNVTGES